jgi:hypothetical protein
MEAGLSTRLCHAASLAMVGFLLWQTGVLAFLLGALLILANWPWTLMVIKPVNDRLMQTDLAAAGPGTCSLLHKWNQLREVRTLYGALFGHCLSVCRLGQLSLAEA